MSRQSNLEINFEFHDAEEELVKQICCALNDIYSIDEISSNDSGISINVWNSEHYYLAEVMPSIMRTISTFFPDRNIEASGTGEYSVVDDVHNYDASFNHESKMIICSWNNYCEGRHEFLKYCALGPGLDVPDINEIKEVAERHRYNLLIDAINMIADDSTCQSGKEKKSWYTSEHEAIVSYLRHQKNVHIPKEVQEIYRGDFSDCAKIETISFGESVQKIYMNAFRNCNSLREVIIPKNVTELGDGAFASCLSLEKVEIACDLDNLPPKLFQNCDSLREVVITGKVKSISKTFKSLHRLETVILPDSLIKIGSEAFADCPSLETVNFPKSLKTIADNAFIGCTKLKLEIPTNIQVVSPFEVQKDLLVRGVLCIQTETESKDFVRFLDDLNCYKKYKKLVSNYEAQPWYVEYQKELDKLNAAKNYAFSAREELKKRFIKVTFDEYMRPLFTQFTEANEYEKAAKLVEENYSDKEIEKINKALVACFMFSSGYKYKEICSTLGISNSVINIVSRTMQYGNSEVILRLKDECV